MRDQPKEVQEIVYKTLEWLCIRDDPFHPDNPANLQQLKADAWHSSLLSRLLVGEKPTPTPPPTAFSYPWVSLLDGQPQRAWVEYESKREWEEGCHLSIFQGNWVILEKKDNEYIVEYCGAYPYRARLWHEDGETSRSEWTIQLVNEEAVEAMEA